MPNHVLNQVYALHKTKELFAAVKGKNADDEEVEVTFHRVIPQPEEVKRSPKCLPGNYSGPNWYEFNISHWGTKWDAYDVNNGETYLEFNTAWDTPEPVIKELAKILDDIVFCIYADESLGDNCGAYYYTPDGRREEIDGAYLFAYHFQCGDYYDAAVREYIEWHEDEDEDECEDEDEDEEEEVEDPRIFIVSIPKD